jgi:hypothetical protein
MMSSINRAYPISKKWSTRTWVVTVTVGTLLAFLRNIVLLLSDSDDVDHFTALRSFCNIQRFI